MNTPGLQVTLKLSGEDAATFAAALERSGAFTRVRDIVDAEFLSTQGLPLTPRDDATQQYLPTPPEPSAHLLRLSRKLRTGTDAERSDRIRLAYSAGRADALRAQQVTPISEPPEDLPEIYISSRPTYFIVLRGQSAPFWTRLRERFEESIKPERNLDLRAVYRTLDTQAELEAFLAGLGAQPPIPESF